MTGRAELTRLPGARGLTATLAAAALALAGTAALTWSPGAGHDRVAPSADLSGLPLSFERNDGQAAADVQFIARAPGYALALTADGSRLALGGAGHAVLTSRFVGSTGATVAGDGPPSGHVSYLVGNRPSAWHTAVPAYAGVEYQRVWPGIDVAFHGNRQQLEYDYVVAPGADPGRIAQRLTGARSLRIDGAGDLVIGLPGGAVRQRAPVSYQERDGRRVPVASRFVLHGNTVRVAVGQYDRSKPLVIDPTLSYATYLGGTLIDYGVDIVVDDDGNTYVTGQTNSAGLATDGAYDEAGAGQDAFVAKLAPDGGSLVWLTYLGGSGLEEGDALALDADDHLYVSGITRSTDFPTVNPYQSTRASPPGSTSDVFVARLSDDGDALTWSTYLGGTGDDTVGDIAVDSSGRTLLAGRTTSHDFPTAGGGLSASFKGGTSDGFVAELGASGSSLPVAGYLGGSASDSLADLKLDGQGRAYVVGDTVSEDFPTTGSAPQAAHAGEFTSDGTVTRLDANLGQIAFSTYLGGTGSDNISGVAVDDQGAAYVVGSTSSSNLPGTAGGFQPAKADFSYYDAFVAKVPTAGGPSGWASYLGGSNIEFGTGIGIDGDGNSYVTGQTYSVDYPTSDDAFQDARLGDTDGFLAGVSPDGAELTSSTYLGGSQGESGNGIAVGPDGDVLVTGVTYSTNFPASDGALQSSSGGSADAFVFVSPTRRATAVSVTCGTPSRTPGQTATCTATVTDTGDGPSSTPTGTVAFKSDGDGVFSAGAACDIDGPQASGVCSVTYTPTTVGSGAHKVTAFYRGDGTHAGSAGSATVIVKGLGGGTGDGGGSPAGPPAAPAGATPGGSADDVIDEFGFSSPTFRAADSGPSATAAAKPVGTIVSFELARAARVTFVVQRPSTGRSVRHGRKTLCDKPTKKNRRKKACTRWTAVKGSFARDGVAGVNRFRFSGRMAGRKLTPGRYRLMATPTVGGKRATPATAAFRIVR